MPYTPLASPDEETAFPTTPYPLAELVVPCTPTDDPAEEVAIPLTATPTLELDSPLTPNPNPVVLLFMPEIPMPTPDEVDPITPKVFPSVASPNPTMAIPLLFFTLNALLIECELPANGNFNKLLLSDCFACNAYGTLSSSLVEVML